MSSSSNTKTAEWVPELLAGFRFHPKEEQMVNFLKKKMEGKDSQASHNLPESGYQTWEPGNQSISLFLLFLREMMQGKCIPEIDVLKSEPWDLPGLLFPDSPFQAREWFAFSRPDHININSPRCNRATKKGFWKITGKPREIKSQEHSFTCKKRTLTFHIGRVSNSEKTNWVMHEYFPTESKLGSSSFVLVRVKNKSANHKSDSKKLKDTSISNEFADPSTGGYIDSNSENQPAAAVSNHMITDTEEFLAYKELENAVLGSDNHDAGLAGGGSPSKFDERAVDDMIQEYLLRDHPPAEPPQPPELGNVPDVSNNEFSNRQSASNHMITDTEEFLAYKELENAVLGSDSPDAGLAGGGSPSDFDDQAVDDMIQELQLCVELVEDLDWPFPPPEPPQLGNVPDAYNHECRNWQPPIGDNYSFLISKNNWSTNYGREPVSNIPYGSPDERISQTEENLGSLFDPPQQDDYTLDALHANNPIGCNGSQFPYPEISTLFPESS